jgi:lysophospholipase L1-like esterase
MMKYCSIWFFLLFISLTGHAQHKKKGIPFPANVTRILFLGNSITYQGDYITDIEAYLVTRFPKRHFEYINVGLPSETVSGLSEDGHAGGAFPRPDLHERLARVLALTKPDLVFANYGMNDGIYLPLNTERFEKFKAGIRWMHNEVVKSGAEIIHLTPPIYNEKIGGATGYNGVLDAYSNWLLSLKDSLHWKVIDIHFPMAAYQQERQVADPDFSLAKDGVHPGDLGHWIMARQVLMYLDNNTALATAQDISFLLAKNAHGQEIFQLVKERQLLMKDAWLSAAKHTRPGMNTGLPLDTAKLKAATIESRIRELLK